MCAHCAGGASTASSSSTINSTTAFHGGSSGDGAPPLFQQPSVPNSRLSCLATCNCKGKVCHGPKCHHLATECVTTQHCPFNGCCCCCRLQRPLSPPILVLIKCTILKSQFHLLLCCLVPLLLLSSISAAHPKLNFSSNKMRYYKSKLDYQAYNALIGNAIALPCNITPPSSDDDVSLILWYRGDMATPIWTVDGRMVSNLQSAKHFSDSSILTNRATFNITYPVSYLRFSPVVDSDTAEYRCRVDFRRGRTINRVMQLNVIVPTKKISIYDSSNNYINDIAGPFNEDSSLNLTCESEGGNPLPIVKWWRGDALLSEVAVGVSKSVVRNVARFPRLLREHLMMPLTCEASNTNLTVPVTKTVLIDLNLKPTEVRIIEPLVNMTAGQRVELVCQSSGSRPPAKITWRKNQKLLEHYSESTSDDGAVTTNFLTFVPSKEDNGKLLACTAFNPQFSDSHSIQDTLHLDVSFAPILSLLLGASAQRQEILEGNSVYFDCNIEANPQVHKVGWLFNGNELNQNEDDNTEIRNNSIIIRSVKKEHIGAYQCYAENTLSRQTSEVVHLNVKYTPTCIADNELFIEAQPFEELTIGCTVTADPNDVLFFWEFNSSSSLPGDNANLRNKPLMAITNDGLRSELKFTPRSPQDYGKLYCYGSNRLGLGLEKPCVFRIGQAEVPDAPQNCSLTNVTAATLTVQCSTSNAPVRHSEQYHLEIYNDANKLVKNMSSFDGVHFHVNDLPPGFSFNLFVYAANINGRSEKVQLNANTLVGEPRKLEHIEHKINVKPLMVLALLFACLLAFTLIFLFVLLKLRNRYKAKHKSRKPCTVFDTSSAVTSAQPAADATSATAASEASAYSLQMRPCSATDNLPADSAEIITLANFTESCNGGLGTSNGATILNHLASSNELMAHPYLELTNLDRLLESGIIDQKQATDYPLVHSSKDHVAICPEIANISGELMYLHATVTDNSKVNTTFYSDCLVLDKSTLLNGDGLLATAAGTDTTTGHVSTIPCIIVNQPNMSNVLYSTAKAEPLEKPCSAGQSMLLISGPSAGATAPDDCPLPKSATKVRFSE